MTTAPRPALKSLTSTPDQPRPAEPTGAPAASGAPRIAARQGVRTACRPDPHPTGGPRVIAWLRVTCPPDWRAPVSAVSHCGCGRHITAKGRPAVMALVEEHAAHRARCPLHTAPEMRHAS